MIPSTGTGVILFLVFLMPGFAFTLTRERHGPTRTLSAFRESVLTVFVSAISAGAGAIVALIVAAANPNFRQLAGSAIASPTGFEKVHPFWAASATLVFLVVASSIAALCGTSRARRFWLWLRRSARSESHASSWWLLLHDDKYDQIIGLTLHDGTWISGELLAFSRDSEETSDRAITLRQPIYVRATGSDEAAELDDITGLSVSARDILYLTVEYRARSSNPTSPTANTDPVDLNAV